MGICSSCNLERDLPMLPIEPVGSTRVSLHLSFHLSVGVLQKKTPVCSHNSLTSCRRAASHLLRYSLPGPESPKPPSLLSSSKCVAPPSYCRCSITAFESALVAVPAAPLLSQLLSVVMQLIESSQLCRLCCISIAPPLFRQAPTVVCSSSAACVF
ncbi:hypothetical protein HN51_065511 [Arachis hypogaea]